METVEAKASALLEMASALIVEEFTDSATAAMRLREQGNLYEKAANWFKYAQMHQQAGETYKKAAECYNKVNCTHDTASMLTKAASCYSEVSADTAVDSLKMAIAYYITEGRFQMAARLQKDIAGILEKHDRLAEAALEYEEAGNLHAHGSPASADACYLSAAELYARLRNYEKATVLFEKLADGAVQSPLRIYSVNNYLFKAALCSIALGNWTSDISMRYRDKMKLGGESVEYDFLLSIVDAIGAADSDAFTQSFNHYASIVRLETWQREVLQEIARKL